MKDRIIIKNNVRVGNVIGTELKYEEDLLISSNSKVKKFINKYLKYFNSCEEEAGNMWKIGTNDYTFIEKYPAQIGTFYKNIIAGHIGTSIITNDSNYHNIYFDGYNHYYIDGTVSISGVIPVIMIDIDNNKYYSLDENGINIILPYNKMI